MRFGEIVRSSRVVRDAFAGMTIHRIWWKIVLSLHGKPVSVDRHSPVYAATLASGFQFYGILYSIVSAVMVTIAFVLGGTFWLPFLLVSACALAMISQLAFAGARRYSTDFASARILLIVFFIGVIGFASMVTGCVLMAIHEAYPSVGVLSVTAAAVFQLFGVGSYVIEILFLVSEEVPQ